MKQLVFLLFSALTLNSAAQSKANFVIMNQYINDMVYDSQISKVLVSIPSKDYVHGNSIGYLDPVSANLSNNYFIGSDPRPIELTESMNYLYVGLDGSKNVKKFNILTHTVEQTINLGYDRFSGQYFANNISCQPGNDSVIAVVLSAQGYSRGVSLFKNGVKLPDSISTYPTTVDLVHFYTPSVLFGYNNSNSGYDFSTFFVNSKGIKMVNHVGSLITGYYVDFSICKGLAISDNGTILDLSGGTPYSLATISIPKTQGYGVIHSCFDTTSNLLCYATKGFWNDSIYIFRYNASTFLKYDQILVNGFKGDVSKIICWGKSKYIVSTSDGKLLIINGILPGISTQATEFVTSTTVNCYGEINSEGSSDVISRGVCWSKVQNPTIADNVINNGSGPGQYSVTINNLTPNTIYYFRAFATNESGTSYGNEITFKTSGTGINQKTGNNQSINLNPENNIITLSGFIGNPRISVFDINGRLVKINQVLNNQVNISDFQNGVYIIKIETPQGNFVQKIIKY